MLHLELELPDAIDEGHERRGVHEALELDVERIEDVLARSHREQLFHRLRRPVAAPTGLVERLVQREDAGHLHVMPELFDAHPLLRERDRVELVSGRVRPMHPLHDLLVQAREGAAVELLVHHPVLLDRPELRGRLRPDDPQGRHELRIGHLVRGPDAAGEVPGRGGVPDDLLRESREAIVLRHDHAESGHRRLRVEARPVRPIEDRRHLGEVRLLPALPLVRPLLREGLDSELVEESHANRCDAR